MKIRPIGSGAVVLLASGAIHARGESSNGVKDDGEGEWSKKITRHLLQAPALQPR
jgi:hypothetical protein